MNAPTIGIVGYGRFGQLLTRILAADHAVNVYDVAHPTGLPQGATAAPLEQTLASEVVFYAVPISSFRSTIQEHSEIFQTGPKPTLVVDVLSVKLHPRKVFSELLPEGIPALLTHPMFGPDSVEAGGLEGNTIVVDKFTATDDQYHYWHSYFVKRGLNVAEMTADRHDELAAQSQGVAHFIGRVLEEMHMEPTSIDTVGAKKLLEIKEQTCNDTWQLFTDLQVMNPYTVGMRVGLGKAVSSVYSKLLPNRINKEELHVGIQGGQGSFNEEAARYYLDRGGHSAFKLEYLYTTARVLDALHEGEIDRGQFAIHNSIGGVVEESIRAMASHTFKIVEQFSIKISHALMVHKDANLEDVTTIMTHPQVLKQCKKNLSEKYARFELTSGEGELIDHANVAAQIAAGLIPPTVATMGSRVLAEVHGLRIVEDNLQDLSENFTSFLWVERA